MSTIKSNLLPKVLSLLFVVLSLVAIRPATAQPWRVLTGQSVSIVLPAQPIPAEKTAAEDLQHYLTEIVGGAFVVESETAAPKNPLVIYVGDTQFAAQAGIIKSTFGYDEWLIKTQGNALILAGGGTRGALYATYHFLEDECGVRWWNPFEETVPKSKALSIPVLNRRGTPAFRSRAVYPGIGGADYARFAARSRQNGVPLTINEGGVSEYNLPSVHSFFKYLPPEKYFKDHPDWYLVPDGKAPTVANAQLCLSNQGMREEFLKVLREKISDDRARAKADNVPPIKIYDVSQNDNRIGFVCGDNQALVDKEGSESAALLDFVNYLADSIKDEYPDVIIYTLAYFSGEKAPKTMRARDNVLIVLTDTESNVLLPITAARNSAMRENVEQWAKHSNNLRIWDYNITYVQPQSPTPTMHTYPIDLQFFQQHNVDGMFVEFEEPLTSDMRDLKVWALSKLLENPRQDYSALVTEFTDGFYGPAGTYIRQYLTTLQTAAEKSNSDVTWFSRMPQFRYLNLKFLRQADGIYEKAAAAVKDDPILARRVRRARSAVDDSILQRYTELTQECVSAGNTPASMPLNRDVIEKRYRQSRNEQIDMRVPEIARAAAHEKANTEIDDLIASAVYVPLPAQFKDIPADRLFSYNAHVPRKDASMKLVVDPEAASGTALRYEIPADELVKGKLPMPWGIYDDSADPKYNPTGYIKATDVPGPGYHWYKLGETVLTPHAYLYFFWSWYIQNPLDDAYDPTAPDAKFEVWASLKFAGPDFPFSKADDVNAISLERVIVVRK